MSAGTLKGCRNNFCAVLREQLTSSDPSGQSIELSQCQPAGMQGPSAHPYCSAEQAAGARVAEIIAFDLKGQ